MAHTITIQDQSPFGKVQHRLAFVVQDEVLTARDLIRQRVLQEVALYNSKPEQFIQLLVQPAQREKELNLRRGKSRQVDGEKQVRMALQAFEQNGFFILVDDHQVESLDEVIRIAETTSIDFIKLVPLVGG